MKKLVAGLSAVVLAVSPLGLAQEAGGGRAGGGAGRGGGPGGGQMQERMKEAWAAVDKEACFKAMDTDADGTITKEEFGKADLQAVFGAPLREAMAKRAGMGAGPGAAVGPGGPQQWDKNGDGKVTADEFPRGPEAFKKLLENNDKDGDGALSTEEMKAAREAMQQRQQERQQERQGQQQ